MRLRAILGLLPVLLSTTGAAPPAVPDDIAAPSGIAANIQYHCLVMRELKGGALSLSRAFGSDGLPAGPDTLYWIPRNQEQSLERPLSLELSYEPESTGARKQRSIVLKLDFRLVYPLPATASMQIGSSSPPRRSSASMRSPLTIPVFHTGDHLAGSLTGTVPLDQLLKHAGAHKALPWTLIRTPESDGGIKVLARGTTDIGALREAVAALPALRKVFAAKSSRPLVRCERVEWAPPPEVI